jgi:hypothetical protein
MQQYLFIFLLSLFIGAIVFLRLNQANIRGRRGERRISSRLQSLPSEYHVFNDVYIEVQGRSIQIDHIIVSRYGIFVIETKNYTGWIYGNDKSEYWIKNMYGNKYQFRNPLKQNYSHVKSLQCLLNIPESKFIPIVVFLNGATLKCDTMGIVIYSHQLRNTILSYSTLVFSDIEVTRVTELLSSACIVEKNRRSNHVDRIKEGINEKQALIVSGICPRCRGKLVVRKGKYGEFLGCSNYPQCNFKSNV